MTMTLDFLRIRGEGWYEPIQDGTAKGSGRAGTAKERVPNRVGETLRLALGREADGSRRTSDADGHDLALRLTRGNV